MITEFILRIWLFVPMQLLERLPVFNFDFVIGSMEPILTFLDYAAYFFPLATFNMLFEIIIAEEIFKCTVALVKLIVGILKF